MITLTLEWREVLWWMQGGMSGSHLRWSVYDDMVNKVWPQCSEQERRNMWFVMRRDLGSYWRPDGWSGFDMRTAHGEGEWKPENEIYDKTPWTYFRQVLARFDPENQYAVTLPIKEEIDLRLSINGLCKDSIIDAPIRYVTADGREAFDITSHPYLTVRAYKWQDLDGHDAYFINWRRRCDPDKIAKVEKLEIHDDGTM